MKQGIHYEAGKTSTQMAEKTSIRILLAIAAANNWPVEHFDFTSAYLHEEYKNDRPVYVKQHPRFDGTQKHNCKAGILVGNLYGTPPASNIYFEALVKHLHKHGLRQTQTDPSVFVKISKRECTAVAVSMDDFLVIANAKQYIENLYNALRTKYNIKRLGEPKKYLNWKIARAEDGSIHISQPQTIIAILEKLNMAHANPKNTPSPENLNNTIEQTSTQLDKTRAHLFRQTIGDLRYPTDSTRPDIQFTVNKLATVMHQPTEMQWQALKWLLRYLRATTNHGITYTVRTKKTAQPHLRTYSDADFANSRDRKSYTGIVHTINNAPVSWTSRKQPVVVLSTCEAEYLAASTATQQTNWIRRLLQEIHAKQTNATPHLIDNRAAIQIATNGAPTKRRKLIDIRVHHIRDNLKRNITKIQHIPSPDNKADAFTKPPGKTNFKRALTQLAINHQPQKHPSATGGTVRPHTDEVTAKFFCVSDRTVQDTCPDREQ